MQIKAGFKKEWFQFSRTFRLWGILIATVSFSLADPLMYWAMNALLGSLTDTDMYGSIGGAVDIENSLGMLFETLAPFLPARWQTCARPHC